MNTQEKNWSEESWAALPTIAREITQTVVRVVERRGGKVLLVGGAVRDWLLGLPIKDVDFMLEHPADEVVNEVAKWVGGRIVKHDKFLTFSILLPGGDHFDFVTSRNETYSSPGKLPDVHPAPLGEDSRRRDFTVNAIGIWLSTEKKGQLLDPFDGQKDIQKKWIRVLHSMSFVDDPTRIFRAARFLARLNFSLESQTQSLLKAALAQNMPNFLSPVRLRNELAMIMKEDDPLKSLRILEEWGGLAYFQKDWKVLPAHGDNPVFRASSYSEERTIARWAGWLSPWGKSNAQKFLADFGFEKNVKKRVIEQL